MTLPLPRYVIAKPLADGSSRFYFNVPKNYRELGCTVLNEALGRDYRRLWRGRQRWPCGSPQRPIRRMADVRRRLAGDRRTSADLWHHPLAISGVPPQQSLY